jgi:hypothetical protein
MRSKRRQKPFFRLGSTDDHDRFAAEFSRSLTPLQHLQALEEMRRAWFYPTGAPPRISRVAWLLREGPMPISRRRRPSDKDLIDAANLESLLRTREKRR